jgi:protein-disulfide isomerase
MKHVYAGMAVLMAAAAAGCSSSPSPEELERTLNDHPQILYRFIEKHPAEFIDALNRAVRVAQSQEGQRAEQAERDRQDAEFKHPKVPILNDSRAVRGDRAAPVTIVEYTDFQCPYCRREEQVLAQVLEKYPGKVRLVIKQTPLEIHPQAMPAAQMFEALAMQSPEIAWRFHDDLFANQAELGARGQAFIEDAARRAGADLPRALRDAKGAQVRTLIDQDLQEGRQFGFSGTPGILINGVSFDGAYPQPELEKVIDRHLRELGKA